MPKSFGCTEFSPFTRTTLKVSTVWLYKKTEHWRKTIYTAQRYYCPLLHSPHLNEGNGHVCEAKFRACSRQGAPNPKLCSSTAHCTCICVFTITLTLQQVMVTRSKIQAVGRVVKHLPLRLVEQCLCVRPCVCVHCRADKEAKCQHSSPSVLNHSPNFLGFAVCLRWDCLLTDFVEPRPSLQLLSRSKLFSLNRF